MWSRLHRNASVAVTQERLNHLEQVEMQYYNLEAEHHGLKGEFKKLEEKFRAERVELRRLQAVDFAKGKKDSPRSHDSISQSLDEIFSKSVDWAREYFKIDLKDFQIDDFDSFKEELRSVLWDDSWRTKKFLNVSHLVQAVVAGHLAVEISDPFGGCEQGFRRHFGGLYNVMLKENAEEAYRWRATTLSAYERSGKWPPSPPTSPHPSTSPPSSLQPGPQPTDVQSYRDQHYDDVVHKIDVLVGPLAHRYFPQRNEEMLRKCREFVKAACELAAELGKHLAGLEVFDKAWFESLECARAFICGDERMKDRFGEEDLNPGEKLVVEIVLRPCLMKYGNGKSVWIPALVDLRRPPRPGF